MADNKDDVASNISNKTKTALTSVWVDGSWVNVSDTNQRNNMQNDLNKVGKTVAEQQTGIKTAQQTAENAMSSASAAIESSKVNSQAIIAMNSATSEAKSDAANAFDQAKSAMSAATSNSSALKSQSVVIDSTASQVALKADQTAVDALKDTVTANSAAISVQADEIKQKVTSSDVQGLLNNGGYATQTWTSSQIDLTSNKFSLNVSALQTQVNNSAVGTNLLTGTSSDLTVDDSSNTSQGWKYATVYDDLIAGSVYTFSSEVSVLGTATSIDVKPYNPTTGNTINDSYTTFSIVDGKISGLVNPTDGYTELIIYAGNSGNTHGNKVTFHHMKLEKGSVATDWCPNPADNATVTSVTNLEAAVDGLQTTVSNKVNTTDYNSKVTQLSNLINAKVATTDYNAEITVLNNNINSKVAKGSTISQINQEAGGNTLIQVASGKGKLLLDAATTVFGGAAFITDAYITDINADKITAGTIKGNLIQASSITADKLSLNMLQLVNDTLATVSLTANQISFSDSSRPDGVRVAIDGNGLTMNDFTSDNAPVASFGVRQLGSTGIYGVMLDFAKDIPNEFFALSKEGTAYQANPQNSVMLWTNTMDKLANAEMGFNFYDYVSFHKPLVIKDKVYNSWGDKSFHLENFNSAGIGILNDAGAGICLGNDGHLYLINKRKYTDVVVKWGLPS